MEQNKINGDLKYVNQTEFSQSQFENSSYKPDVSLGLTDMSEILLPTFTIGKEIGATAIKNTPTIINNTKYNFLSNPTAYTQGVLDFGTSSLPYSPPALSGFGFVGFATGAAFDSEGTIDTMNKGVDLIKSIPIKIENNINGNSNGK